MSSTATHRPELEINISASYDASQSNIENTVSRSNSVSPSHRRQASLNQSGLNELTHNNNPGNTSSVQRRIPDSERNELFAAVEFVAPAEGTPAAAALAANAAIKVTKLDKGLHKFRSLKRPKMKSLNIVKKLNKTTKQRREKRHFSKNFKGKVIDGVHELYTLTAGMMLGIRFSLARGYEQEEMNNGRLDADDFQFIENVPFPPKGSTEPPFITPPHSLAHTFKFKSYAPKIFKQLREFFDIDPVDYMQSVCGDYNYLEFISNSKSGQFFFYSHDGKYMLKTQTKEENKFLKQILPQYYKYLKENPHSLLVRILGMHRIKMYHLRRKVHFVIMASVFDTPAQINTIYDLKGSLVGRSATAQERANGGVLKDNDLMTDHRKLHLGTKKTSFMLQLQKDARFLATLNVMDYSLLVGIHDRTTRTNETIQMAGPGSVVTTGSDHVASSVNDNPHAASSTNSVVSHDKPAVAGASTANASSGAPTITHSNTPFRRSIHADRTLTADIQQLAEKLRKHHLEQAEGGAAPGEGDSQSTTPVTAELGYEDSTHSRFYEMKVSTPEASPRNSAAFQVQRTSSLNESQAARLEQEILVVNQLDDPSQYGQVANESGDEDDGDGDGDDDYEDIDEGDSDVEETNHNHHNALPPVPIQQPNQRIVRPAMPLTPPRPKSQGRQSAEKHTNDEVDYRNIYPHVSPNLDQQNDLHSSKDRDDNPAVTNSGGSNMVQISDKYEIVYGNGVTTRRPWTSRKDGGINSHNRHGRGNEIYFVGIIDILQEYNTNKRFETIIKGLTNDVREISSVDPRTYASRFVKFMDTNTD